MFRSRQWRYRRWRSFRQRITAVSPTKPIVYPTLGLELTLTDQEQRMLYAELPIHVRPHSDITGVDYIVAEVVTLSEVREFKLVANYADLAEFIYDEAEDEVTVSHLQLVEWGSCSSFSLEIRVDASPCGDSCETACQASSCVARCQWTCVVYCQLDKQVS